MSNTELNWRLYTDEFKSQIVQLYLSSKRNADIRNEYDRYLSTLDGWINQHLKLWFFQN